MEATSLTDILDDNAKPQPPVAPEAVEPAAPAEGSEPKEPQVDRVSSKRAEHRRKEYAAQGRDPESGQFLKKAEPAAAPAAEPAAAPAAAEPAKPAAEPAKPAEEPMTSRERAAFAALQDERRKRQAAEQRLAGQPPAKEPEKKPFWDDPEGALRAHNDEIRLVATNTRLQTAEIIARSKYSDFDEKVAEFGSLLEQNPALAQQWLNSPDPGEFCYRTAKNNMELRQAGSLDKLRTEIETKARADERAKVEAEFKAREAERVKKAAALPGSLSDVSGAAPRQTEPAWGGPTPLADILASK